MKLLILSDIHASHSTPAAVPRTNPSKDELDRFLS
jgi:hypothetical protein